MKKHFLTLVLLSLFSSLFAEEVKPNFLSESWCQTRPYNNLMPRYIIEADAGDSGYEEWDGRAPTGCVATQMAQLFHYWQWPKRYENFYESESPRSVAVESKGNYTIVLQANGYVPYEYDCSDLTKARLSLLAATLGHLDFNRNGTGGYTSVVASKLAAGANDSKTYYEYGGEDKEWKTAPQLLKAGFPLPATVPKHAIVIQGWKEDSDGAYVYRHNGSGGGSDGWVSVKSIESVFLFYPRMRVQLDTLPPRTTGELKVGWAFPEGYMSLYPTQLSGFRITAETTVGKEKQFVVDETLDPKARSFELKLTTAGEYEISVTPIFSGGAVKHTVYSDTATVVVSGVAYSKPVIEEAPANHKATFNVTTFEVKCSDSVETLELHPGIVTIHESESFSMQYSVSATKKAAGLFEVSIDASKLPTRFNHQKMLLTLEAKDRDWNADYKDVLVEFLTSEEGENTGTDPEENTGTDPEKQPDYILISPKNFVGYWQEYIAARKAAHPDMTFAVKDAAEIYAEYKDLTPAEKIKEYIASRVKGGTKYIVLGGAWSNITTDDGKSEESFILPGDNGDKYKPEALSLDNTIPGFTDDFKFSADLTKSLAFDYEYALIDSDFKPDVVVARIPLIPWPRTDGTVPTFEEMIKGYGRKVAKAEDSKFSGAHRYACAGAGLCDNPMVNRGDVLWPTERHRYCDGYYDFFDPRHPASVADGIIAARRRFRDFFAKYNPVKGAMVIPMEDNTADKFFADENGWEAIIAKTHGWAYESWGTGLNDARFREAKNLVKFGVFAMPCLTGKPDRTTTWNGWTNLYCPSMGAAAICNPDGGEVVGFHNTHDAPGEKNLTKVTNNTDPYATQYETCLLAALFEQHLSAGDAWKVAHEAFIDKQGTGITNKWMAYESILYGDPLVAPSAVNEPVCGEGAVPARVLFK